MKAAIAFLLLAAPAFLLLALPAAGQLPAVQSPTQPGQFLPGMPPPFVQSVPPVAYPGLFVAPVTPVTPAWLPQSTADLRALDKVTARAAAVTGRLGDTIRFGSLSVIVRQCIVRPPDHAPDAAAWVEITDANGGPGFRGWMLASAPSLSMLEHPVYDIRVAGCRP
jgi:hypothetical protein